MQKLFSIITINYNNSDGLRKTLESVRCQHFSDYEHIIIDGGSTDNSVEVIKEFLQDKQYKSHVSFWCSKKDAGIYPAMNKGIKHATGKYVSILNSGDTYLPNTLEIIAPIANTHNEILYGGVNFVKNGNFLFIYGTSHNNLEKQMIAHPSCFVPRTLYDKYNGYNESYKIAGDYDFFLNMYKNGEAFFYTNLVLANFETNGISSINTGATEKETIEVQKKYHVYIPPRHPLLKKIFKTIRKIIK